MYEVFKFIAVNYGPAIAAVFLMIYLCLFTKKAVSGNEKELKDQLSMVLRENAELKVELKKCQEQSNKTMAQVNAIINDIVENAEEKEVISNGNE